ncbi:MAG: phosphoglycerate mutase [Micavibrio sp.]|nr:phosphoglycerate mutase [Micavibrio sp.]|tara:strand:- start:13311 stop:13811 length:501 start_codon:yes stop_codon:yes gene_type:complete
MKTIYLLRHAEAEANLSDDDFCRNLSKFGTSQATNLGETLRQKNIKPDRVFCSPSYRTLQTFQALGLQLAPETVSYTRELYDAPESVYLELLETLNETIESVMFVGHNPAIFTLALSLTEFCGTEDIYSYEPCTFTIFENSEICWDKMRKRCFSLKETIHPDMDAA